MLFVGIVGLCGQLGTFLNDSPRVTLCLISYVSPFVSLICFIVALSLFVSNYSKSVLWKCTVKCRAESVRRLKMYTQNVRPKLIKIRYISAISIRLKSWSVKNPFDRLFSSIILTKSHTNYIHTASIIHNMAYENAVKFGSVKKGWSWINEANFKKLI